MAEEIKGVIEGLGRDFEEFKKANDQRLKEIEEKGHADPILTEKVDKMSAGLNQLDEMKSRIERAETMAARRTKYSADGSDLDEKAAKWAEMNAKRRGIRFEGEFGASDLKEYRKAFQQYMRKGQMAEDLHAKALSVGIDPDGGYTVEPDTNGRIVEKIFETSPMRQVAAQQTIGTDALEGLYDLDEAASGWVGETQARPETSTPKLASWRIPVHEIYAFPFATQKVLDDAMIDLEAWLSNKVADKFAREENEAFVNGDGVGKPRGFLTYPSGTTLPGTIQRFFTGEAGAFAASPDGGDILLDAIYGMKQGLRSGARWHMPRSVTAEVRKLKDGEGRYLWQPGIAAGEPASLLGYAVLEFEDMPELADGSLSIAFANMGEAYQIVDRHGIRVLRDPYTNKPFVGFYSIKRTGGDVLDFDAIKLIEFGAE